MNSSKNNPSFNEIFSMITLVSIEAQKFELPKIQVSPERHMNWEQNTGKKLWFTQIYVMGNLLRLTFLHYCICFLLHLTEYILFASPFVFQDRSCRAKYANLKISDLI